MLTNCSFGTKLLQKFIIGLTKRRARERGGPRAECTLVLKSVSYAPTSAIPRNSFPFSLWKDVRRRGQVAETALAFHLRVSELSMGESAAITLQ